MSKTIIRSFVPSEIQDFPITLYARTNGAYTGFTNTYGVWPNTSDSENASYTIVRTFYAPYTGVYRFRATVDNSASVYVDGSVVFSSVANFKSSPSVAAVTLNAGSHEMKFNVQNTGGPGTFAMTISNAADNLVLWDTRTYVEVAAQKNVYTLTMPFAANITASLWGGGGGGGGMDAGTAGGIGSSGLYNSCVFPVSVGDVLEVVIGNGGFGGFSSASGANGGLGGDSRINLNATSIQSFNGGSGGNAGSGGTSGGGGGGGGATVLIVNGTVVAAAGGGGGGGGAGNDGNAADRVARRNAVFTNNANGLTPTDYRGENGQNKSGDGGGGGGGGGGYPGGQGGSVPAGDTSAFAGQCGGNYPLRVPQAGEVTSFGGRPYSIGGASGGGNGYSGFATLEFSPTGLAAVKILNQWKQIGEAFVKVAGSWRPIQSIYVKVNGQWKAVEKPADDSSAAFIDSNSNFGKVIRGFS